MLRILRPNTPVPAWLERIEIDRGVNAQVVVGCWSIVYAARGAHHWWPLFPWFGSLIYVSTPNGGHIENLSITGQSPKGGKGGVMVYSRPVLSWELIATALCLVLLVMRA